MIIQDFLALMNEYGLLIGAIVLSLILGVVSNFLLYKSISKYDSFLNAFKPT